MGTKISNNPNDSDAFRIDQLRLRPKKKGERGPASEQEKFSVVIHGVLAEVRKDFGKISKVGEGSEDFLDPAVSDFIDEESGERNADLGDVMVEIQFLVESLLENGYVSQQVKRRTSVQISQIEEKLEMLADRYQSGERGVRGVQPDPRYGYLEPDIQTVYDGIHKALEKIKDHLGIR